MPKRITLVGKLALTCGVMCEECITTARYLASIQLLGLKTDTIKPLITDTPKSRQPLYSGQITCPRLIYHTVNTFQNLREEDVSQLRITDTDEPQTYFSQYKITSENGQSNYTHQ